MKVIAVLAVVVAVAYAAPAVNEPLVQIILNIQQTSDIGVVSPVDAPATIIRPEPAQTIAPTPEIVRPTPIVQGPIAEPVINPIDLLPLPVESLEPVGVVNPVDLLPLPVEALEPTPVGVVNPIDLLPLPVESLEPTPVGAIGILV